MLSLAGRTSRLQDRMEAKGKRPGDKVYFEILIGDWLSMIVKEDKA
jgi:hypothetical protein